MTATEKLELLNYLDFQMTNCIKLNASLSLEKELPLWTLLQGMLFFVLFLL